MPFGRPWVEKVTIQKQTFWPNNFLANKFLGEKCWQHFLAQQGFWQEHFSTKKQFLAKSDLTKKQAGENKKKREQSPVECPYMSMRDVTRHISVSGQCHRTHISNHSAIREINFVHLFVSAHVYPDRPTMFSFGCTLVVPWHHGLISIR